MEKDYHIKPTKTNVVSGFLYRNTYSDEGRGSVFERRQHCNSKISLKGAITVEVMLGKWIVDKINLIKEKIMESKESKLQKNTELKCERCIA